MSQAVVQWDFQSTDFLGSSRRPPTVQHSTFEAVSSFSFFFFSDGTTLASFPRNPLAQPPHLDCPPDSPLSAVASSHFPHPKSLIRHSSLPQPFYRFPCCSYLGSPQVRSSTHSTTNRHLRRMSVLPFSSTCPSQLSIYTCAFVSIGSLESPDRISNLSFTTLHC
jgi:hypothetical protein